MSVDSFVKGVTVGLLALFIVAALSQTVAATYKPPRQTLVVGTNTPFPPFEYRQGSNTEVIGFDMDLAKLVAKESKKDLTVVDFTDFTALFPALYAKKIDMVASSVTITEGRRSVMSFSDPYFKASQGVLAASNVTKTVSKPSDFNGLRVGYQSKTTSAIWVEANLIDKVRIRGNQSFGDLAVALQYLKTGRIDVVVMDKPVADAVALSDKTLRVAGEIDTGEHYGLVVAKDDPLGLLPKINSVLGKLKTSGEYGELVLKWFK